jgi:hypothetical protein
LRQKDSARGGLLPSIEIASQVIAVTGEADRDLWRPSAAQAPAMIRLRPNLL